MTPVTGLRVSPDEHLALTEAVLGRLAVPAPAARQQAEMLLEADLREHPSHGLRRLDILVRRLQTGLLRADANADHRWSGEAVLTVDGNDGLGPPTAHDAVSALLDRVGRTGVALAGLRRTGHLGMLAPYVERVAAAGCIGMAMTTSEALVHPWGGRRAMVGTNPLAIAVPTMTEPLVLDMATGQLSMGKVLDHAARGLPLPEGSAVDGQGRPTTDARAAVGGAIAPFGGPKGYALGVTLEVLVATLTASALGTDVRGTLDAEYPANKGDVFVVIDPVSMSGLTGDSVTSYLAGLRAEAPAPGHVGVSVPGDRARRVRAGNLVAGVPMAPDTWTQALAIAERLGFETASTRSLPAQVIGEEASG